jgi:3-(3-hydroxy-phenyl)propionate hydroxylase
MWSLRAPYRLQYEQAKYTRIVYDALAERANVSLRFSTALRGLRQSTDRVHVTATTEDGEEQFEADYLIGADDARSVARKALGVPMSVT